MKERVTSQDIYVGVDRRIILKWNFQSMGFRTGKDLFDSVQGQVGGSCKHGNKHSVSARWEKFLECRKICWLLKKDFVV
jgi:hypothetical protein